MGGAKSHTRAYITIWALLAVFTVLEIGAATLIPSGTHARWLSLVLLAAAKALAVALWYMHLVFEKRWLRFIALTPACAAVYAVVLMIEVVARQG